MIFNIQRFSTHDGAGIRTTVFLKGCPLHCAWCSNPESQSFQSELMFDKSKCILCMECCKVSKNNELICSDNSIQINRDKITDAEIFRDICPTKALTVVGDEKSVSDIIKEIEKDISFYQTSGGGVTISGGEPFSQPSLLKKLLSGIKDLGITTYIETCMQVPWSNIENNIDKVDYFLSDLKHVDPIKFKKFTGGDLSITLNNFKLLAERNANICVRIPVIPGFNDSIDEMHEILKFVSTLKNVKDVDFIPYHTFGKSKYSNLEKDYDYNVKAIDFDSASKEYISMAKDLNLNPNIS